MAGGTSTASPSSCGRCLLVGGGLVNLPPRRRVPPPVSRAAAASDARAPFPAVRAPSRSPADGRRHIRQAANTARYLAGAAAAAAGPAAAAVAATPAAGCTNEWSVSRRTLKLACEKPCDFPMLRLTQKHDRLLNALVPSAVNSFFTPHLTCMQQELVVRAKAIVYLKRTVPSLRRAENSWAVFMLVAKASDILHATKKRRERRRALARWRRMRPARSVSVALSQRPEIPPPRLRPATWCFSSFTGAPAHRCCGWEEGEVRLFSMCANI